MITEITNDNYDIYKNLVQAYEAEFSSLTKKRPDNNGIFHLDTIIGGNVRAYVLLENNSAIGFATIEIRESINEIKEFYIVPVCRNNSIGESLFKEVLTLHPGLWEVKQIAGADKARIFWNKVIGKISQNNYTEDIYEDIYWGKVYRQCFTFKS